LYQYDKAEQMIERQLTLMEQYNFKDDEGRADLYLADAQLAFLIEDFSRCREKLILADELYQLEDTMLFNHGLVLNMLGAISDVMGEQQEAISRYRRAIDVFTVYDDKYHAALAYHNLGIVYSGLKQFEEAETLLQRSFDLHILFQDSVELARHFIEMAKLKEAQLQFMPAVDYARKSLKFRELKLPVWHPDVIESEVTLANLLINPSTSGAESKTGHNPEAEQLFDRAISHAFSSPRPEVAIMPLVSKASWLASFGDNDMNKSVLAHQLYLKADSMIQFSRLQYRHQESKIDFTRRVHFAYEHAIANALHLFKSTGKQVYFETALRFCSRSKATAVRDKLHKQTVQQFAGLPDSVLILERQLHLQLGAATQALLMLGDQRNEIYEEKLAALEHVKQKMEQFDEQLEELYPRYYEWLREPEQISVLPEIQKALPSGSLMVEYFIGDKNIFVLAVSPVKFQYWVLDDPQQELDVVYEFVQLMDQSLKTAPEKICNTAYGSFKCLLAEPIKYFSRDEDIRTLRIIPDGIIGKVPFDALLTGEYPLLKAEAPYFVKSYSHSLLYSHRQLLEPGETRKWLGGYESAVFGIDYSGSEWKTGDIPLNSLPFMKEEVSGVIDEIPGKAFLNKNATAGSFRKSVSDVDIVHVAVHGLFEEEHPEISGLIFSPDSNDVKGHNILSLAAIYGLQTNAKFVYLSSCYSGKGNLQAGEGVMSLSRAFTYAGVKSQVITLWEVSDRASVMISKEFYRMIRQGYSKDEALRLAKLSYLKQSPTSIGQHPFFWAGAVVVGDAGGLFMPMGIKYIGGVIIALILSGLFFKTKLIRFKRNSKRAAEVR
jgi:CHAT domain-containing protein